ncbi:hypothetical protein [Zunongwangia pacifica]|uniref:Uncharacterized protein n=1 Tax=Zunongwangia pacifica TaxID=2911062 RepID=A0A9X2CLU8_9FLAO|nr:hypothetical protein [Zunongwangia pacifica]MCL6220426.1 hypothetical protein [Zunongwangia pacifica]
MSIALSTLILFFLLIPGILFRRFYYSEEFSKEYFKETFFGVFIATFLPALLFQFIWYFLANIFNQKVDLYILGNILSQSTEKSSFQNVEKNFLNIITYNSTMFFASGLCGYILKKIVRLRKWDRYSKFFRFQNSWHYILKGEFFDFPRADMTLDEDTVEDIEFVFVDAIVEINNESYLYDGILVDYELSNDGGLNYISLTGAERRNIKNDSKIVEGIKQDNSKNYYPIKGHTLLLKYSEIKNLNFTYYTLSYNDEKQEFTPREVE